MEKTTIQVNGETLERLKLMKRHARESYDEMLNYLIDEVQDDELTEEDIEDIKEALEQYKKGEFYSLEDVARELKVTLD